MPPISTYEVSVPEYDLSASKPDFQQAAIPIVQWLRDHFANRKVGLRFLGSMEHPGKSVDDLVDTIKDLGHDRYDPDREGDRYENIESKSIEIFALEIQVGKELGGDGEEQIGHALNSFYSYPLQESKAPIRVDIAIVYDLNQLQSVEHRYEGREHQLKTDGYVFRNPEKKSEAVLAVLKIL